MSDVIRLWNLVESDFQREYNIDLATSDMSWRKFQVLLGGLTGDSVFFSVIREENKKKTELIEDPDMIVRDIMLSMGGRKG